MAFLKGLSIAQRLYGVVAVLLVGMVVVAGFVMVDMRNGIVAQHRKQAREMVNASISIIKGYHGRALRGEMAEDAAKREAFAALKSLRYDTVQYVWINSMDGIMLMHPTLEGKALDQVRDARGAPIFTDMIEVLKTRDSSAYDYWWKPSADAEPEQKISAVAVYRPWGMVVGTGMFLTDAEKDFYAGVWRLVGVVAAITAGALLMAVSVTRGIVGTLKRITATTTAIAQGSADVPVPFTDRSDEIGEVARALRTFSDVFAADRRRAEEEHARALAEERRRTTIASLSEAFDHRMSEVVGVLGRAAGAVQTSAQTLSQTANTTTDRSAAVGAAAHQASANVQMVASAAEELHASVGEINRQIEESSRITEQAEHEAATTNSTVAGLSDAAQKIGEVVVLINSIAAQTNLLALNATIEAARAGEAGKGFAVVASEVKNLANQTAKATEEIQGQVQQMQAVTEDSVQAIERIAGTIAQMGDVTRSIAAAVEQQNEATLGIARNVAEAAMGAKQVAGNIEGVRDAARQTSGIAGEALGTAATLSQQADTLRAEVERYIHAVRAA
ncbi:methyl-accepting chemotaxis protein [Azospirillum fermentarium]|uniref:methyl-accepting chemotaxis protein n=1 Tax=Azospirillum fermentarium TaxID=1233114 RepID=UPI002227DCA6|nr:methyl-accepting chemotaxis protein [Azospirillum fermentarium]MCW2247400.1 methyl-accepting chemotaxis protein [Azospirillum fermentarium]